MRRQPAPTLKWAACPSAVSARSVAVQPGGSRRFVGVGGCGGRREAAACCGCFARAAVARFRQAR